MNPLRTRSDGRRGAQVALLLIAALLAPAARAAWFADYRPVVEVSAPYVDLHTGPGRGFPVFYSATEGEQLQLLKRRTGWVKVRAARAVEGWIPQAALRDTLGPDGRAPLVAARSLDQHAQRRWEFGVTAGDFDGAASLSGHAGFTLTPNIMLLAEVTQVLGDYSDAVMGSGNLVMVPFPEWRVSPFFRIGTGIIETRPQTTIVDSEDRTDEIVNAGVGATLYLGDRFSMRAEYQRHTVLTSRDDNEEIDQWKAGFSIFF